MTTTAVRTSLSPIDTNLTMISFKIALKCTKATSCLHYEHTHTDF